jgi:hypothetical protein
MVKVLKVWLEPRRNGKMLEDGVEGHPFVIEKDI